MSRPVSGRTLTPHPSPGLREPAVVETSTLQQTKQPPAWVCVWENERESVCVWKDFTRLLTDMFIPVDQCQPHCHGDNHHGNSCVTFIRASRNSLRETLCCFHDAGTSAGLMKGSLLCFYSLLTERSTRRRKEELGLFFIEAGVWYVFGLCGSGAQFWETDGAAVTATLS